MPEEFHTTLFTAIDSSTRIVVDGRTVLMPVYEINRGRRLFQFDHGTSVAVENQPISLMSASGEFKDRDGKAHTIGFVVERPLTAADLRSLDLEVADA